MKASLVKYLFLIVLLGALSEGAENESYVGYRVSWSNLGNPKKLTVEDFRVKQNFGLDEKTIRFREIKNYTAQGYLASKVTFGPEENFVDVITNTLDPAGNVAEKMRVQGLSEISDKWVYSRTNIGTQNGLVVSEVRYKKDGHIHSKNVYDYDAAGRWTNRLYYNDSGLVEYRQSQSFESNGLAIDLITRRSTGTIQEKKLWAWTNQWLQSETLFNTEGEVLRKTVNTYLILTNGWKDPVKSEEKVFRGDGELREWSKFSYDNLGQLIERLTVDGANVFRSKTTYKYDGSQKKIEECDYKTATLIDKRFVITYDPKGNPMEVRQEVLSTLFGENTFELRQLLKLTFEY